MTKRMTTSPSLRSSKPEHMAAMSSPRARTCCPFYHQKTRPVSSFRTPLAQISRTGLVFACARSSPMAGGCAASEGWLNLARHCALPARAPTHSASSDLPTRRGRSCAPRARRAGSAHPRFETSSPHRRPRSQSSPPRDYRTVTSASASTSRIGPSARTSTGCSRSWGLPRARSSLRRCPRAITSKVQSNDGREVEDLDLASEGTVHGKGDSA